MADIYTGAYMWLGEKANVNDVVMKLVQRIDRYIQLLFDEKEEEASVLIEDVTDQREWQPISTLLSRSYCT